MERLRSIRLLWAVDGQLFPYLGKEGLPTIPELEFGLPSGVAQDPAYLDRRSTFIL